MPFAFYVSRGAVVYTDKSFQFRKMSGPHVTLVYSIMDTDHTFHVRGDPLCGTCKRYELGKVKNSGQCCSIHAWGDHITVTLMPQPKIAPLYFKGLEVANETTYFYPADKPFFFTMHIGDEPFTVVRMDDKDDLRMDTAVRPILRATSVVPCLSLEELSHKKKSFWEKAFSAFH